MKRVGLVFLGFVSIIIVYLPIMLVLTIVLTLLGANPSSGNHVPQGPGYGDIFIFMPIAFLVGSIVTGYFSYYEFETKWPLIWMAPILYSNLLIICFVGTEFLLNSFMDVHTPSKAGFFFGVVLPVLTGFYWYFASLAGVILGYLLRERFAKWWYGD